MRPLAVVFAAAGTKKVEPEKGRESLNPSRVTSQFEDHGKMAP